ncbi:hypothetical protein A2Z53_03300 [Candidatus Giovannonibacteria bacterium RIFCSPHIGHO2_02_42_15]|uniref:Transposase IS200-like domain-containing protein n=2 Tax=Candidatus Giovannoniibacteriota TaxID=1752738 RepID=A0A1F5VM68_9BACT|nr:MAG: hypothetical protein UV11_C0042G0004 [Candidatus Giovannonibacteria bacterium GW2011_GWF2_42_19]OGF64502.1 MAG: hypothetical protein A2Z53_03300 [Candidatus Giovannonibacteria bacterium RIFCSPHIGHO2_02_42_15]
MRKEYLVEGEFYHVYNRGVDKRTIFLDGNDFDRFLQSMKEFNSDDPIGSIYENSFRGSIRKKQKKLVDFIAYCLNPNHYHFILKQSSEKGIERFMHRLGMGYAKFFNNKYKRSGALFQGTFKARHINTNEYLLHLSAYINLNYKVHKLGHGAFRSSWGAYNMLTKNTKEDFIDVEIITSQFRNFEEYKEFAEFSLADILNKKKIFKEMESVLLDN